MKYKRQGEILKIIQNQNISTHEQLIQELQKRSYYVTQATVSRDINELGLIKIPLPKRYTGGTDKTRKYAYRYGKKC